MRNLRNAILKTEFKFASRRPLDASNTRRDSGRLGCFTHLGFTSQSGIIWRDPQPDGSPQTLHTSAEPSGPVPLVYLL